MPTPRTDAQIVKMIDDGALNQDLDVKDCEDALASFIMDGHNQAVALSQKLKVRWHNHEKMRDGEGVADDPDDPIVQLGVYLPFLSRFIEVQRSNMMNQLVPDKNGLKLAEAVAQWEGLEEYARKTTAALIDAFKRMAPPGMPGGMLEFLDRSVDDYLMGNCMAVVNHAQIEGAGAPVVMIGRETVHLDEGPVCHLLDKFNVWPWRTDVTGIDQTETTIYDPIDYYEFFRDANFVNKEIVLDAYKDGTIEQRRDPQSQETADMPDEKRASESAKHVRRLVYFGRFPVLELANALEGRGWTEEAMVQAMATKFGFDPAAPYLAQWWDIELAYEHHVIQCRPFPLWLPLKTGPILHIGLLRRNNFLWCGGLYDRAQWDERMANFIQRQLTHLARYAADPAMIIDRESLDKKWRQTNSDDFALEKGMKIYVHRREGNQTPIETVKLFYEAMPLLMNQANRHENNMREWTGAFSAVEGQDRSGTATQGANNLQQGLALMKYWNDRFEHEFMKGIVRRCHAVMRQSVTENKITRYVAASNERQELETLVIAPDHVLNESLIEWRMTGSKSPGNAQAEYQMAREWIFSFIQTGLFDVEEAARFLGKYIEASGKEQLFATPRMQAMQRALLNLQGAFGPEGAMAMMPPYLNGAMQRMQTPQPTGPGGAPMMGNGGGGNLNPMGNNQMQRGGQPMISTMGA